MVKDYIQSTQQAFYFIEDVENIEVGDKVSAFCNNILVGSRIWTGPFTDIPVMGYDGDELTIDYCLTSSIPTFSVEKQNGIQFNLTGEIPSWENNGLLMVASMSMVEALPENYSLASAYPNPFNPTTTISFAIPTHTEVSIAVYNLQGREIVSLASGDYDAGYHQDGAVSSLGWLAQSAHPSHTRTGISKFLWDIKLCLPFSFARYGMRIHIVVGFIL